MCEITNVFFSVLSQKGKKSVLFSLKFSSKLPNFVNEFLNKLGRSLVVILWYCKEFFVIFFIKFF